MSRTLQALLLVALASTGLAEQKQSHPEWLRHVQAADPTLGGARRSLKQAINSFIPPNKGKWENGGPTGIPMIYANLMKDGTVIGWATTYAGPIGGSGSNDQYGTVVWNPLLKNSFQLLPGCGIHDCKNAFCSGQVTTWDNQLLIFGGHGNNKDLTGSRYYNGNTGKVASSRMASPRWYPGVVTLPDGDVLIVGGVAHNGQGGWQALPDRRGEYDNPTYTVFDPRTKQFGGDRNEMRPQLNQAWPIHLFPQLNVLPDGTVAVSAGKTLVNYKRTGKDKFVKNFSYPDRPHPSAWSYPQTGIGLTMPIMPPYTSMLFLASGGSAAERANPGTPASNWASVIDLQAGPNAQWFNVGPMPYPRLMGDALYLCDGTIGFFGGAQSGIAGWSKVKQTYRYKDGSTWRCNDKCTDAHNPIYEAVIFNPLNGKWSAKGSLSEMMQMRLYHSTAILLPDCRVMVAGSDVTNGRTAEIFTPPHLLTKRPRPQILQGPDTMRPGPNEILTVKYASLDPVNLALLIRTGAATHSIAFDARAVYLSILPTSTAGQLQLRMPPNYNVLPPGMYMLVVISNQGVPSAARIISNLPPGQ